ncbi:hypothetical protein PTSG_07907 [Salpingoeca rosetta]|uniref:TLC domain-containing protein n=1 Tax=Salpingoeca rosetta (strain ATCC 50818 / BSB-021) TaxID=946362 RepID=F2UGN9_SALR5|nr:uncharacterized protein PTSG_07907 [Salpingoeca rosetta]EGD75789.1 hypothetical protein PTSG_07907 [Salpingoeca rosetta]|eukprot:XP_004991710.1 hypothetical protein PTSG_07907 [Salpingoeca rosetta]
MLWEGEGLPAVALHRFTFGHGYDVIGLSAVAFAAMFALALAALYVLIPTSPRKTKKPKKPKKDGGKQDTTTSLAGMSFQERVRMTIRMVGPLHAVLVGVPALEAILDVAVNHQDELAPWPESEHLKCAVAVSCGYMIVDGLVNLYLGEGLMLVHHLLTLLTEYAFIMDSYNTHIPSPFFPAAVFLATELTAPFLHCEFLMRKCGVRPQLTLSGVLYTLNLGAIVPAWLLMRIGTFLFLLLKLVQSWKAHRMDAVLSGEHGRSALAQFVHIYFFAAILALLNIFWFFKILNMIATKGMGRRQTAKHTQDQKKKSNNKMKQQ